MSGARRLTGAASLRHETPPMRKAAAGALGLALAMLARRSAAGETFQDFLRGGILQPIGTARQWAGPIP